MDPFQQLLMQQLSDIRNDINLVREAVAKQEDRINAIADPVSRSTAVLELQTADITMLRSITRENSVALNQLIGGLKETMPKFEVAFNNLTGDGAVNSSGNDNANSTAVNG